MKRLTIILLLSVGQSGCQKTPDNFGYNNSLKFVETFADRFLESELFKYDYDVRTQYALSVSDTLKYRAFVKQESSELTAMFYDDNGFELFRIQFHIQLEMGSKWEELRLTREGRGFNLEVERYESLKAIVNMDTASGTVKTVGKYMIPEGLMSDPIAYFQTIDKERERYGIVNLRKLRIGGIVELYFSATDYLLYFPNKMVIEEKQFQDYWNKKIKEGKQLNRNWYYYKSERPLDNG